METYGGRLSSSTRSRAVRNTHETANAMLLKEEKHLDKMKSSSQRTLGKEEERLKKRFEKIEQEKIKSRSRSYLNQDEEDGRESVQDGSSKANVRSRHERGSLQIQDGVDILSRSKTSVSSSTHMGAPLSKTGSRRESLPVGPRFRRSSEITYRERSASLNPTGTEDLLKKKSVQFAGAPKAQLRLDANNLPVVVPFIQISGTDDDDTGSRLSLDSPQSSQQGAEKPPKRQSSSDTVRKLSHSKGNVNDLYTMAFKTAESTDDMEHGCSPGLNVAKSGRSQQPLSSPDLRSRRPSLPSSSSHTTKATLDLKALKELEELLKDTRLYTHKKNRQLDAGPESSTWRLQKKRMQQLEQILTSLKPNQRKDPPPVEFDPMAMLNCTYLRLSKSNVEALEQMVRESGRDPGIHPHSDVTDFKLFDDKPKEEES